MTCICDGKDDLMREDVRPCVWRVMAVLLCVLCIVAQFGTPAYADLTSLSEEELSADEASAAPKAHSGAVPGNFGAEMQVEPTAKNASKADAAAGQSETVAMPQGWEIGDAARIDADAADPGDGLSAQGEGEVAGQEEGIVAQSVANPVRTTPIVTGSEEYGLASQVLAQVNAERAKVGLQALRMDSELQKAAMQRSAELKVSFSHTRPDGTQCFTASSKAYGENIAAGSGGFGAAQVMQGWMNSAGHRENILTSSYRSIGIGCVVSGGVTYWTQLFGGDAGDGRAAGSGSAVRAFKVNVGSDTPSPAVQDPNKFLSVDSRAHIQNVGWEFDQARFGNVSGTVGQGLRLEAIQLSLSNLKTEGSVQYRTHIQNIGWEKDWSSDGKSSGTSGQGLRLEAIQIKLTGKLAQEADVWYRVHAQNYGWLGWAKNGESAGTAGYGYRLEAIQVIVFAKGDQPFANDKSPFVESRVSYRTHVQNDGWQGFVPEGAMSGTSGRSLRLEGINVRLQNQPYAGDIQYRTHVQNLGWEREFKANGDMSGTSGRSLRLEAIQIKLTGEMEKHFDVWYHVHCQNFGWMGWTKNGESAGSAGYAYRLEGIEICLRPRGSAAPGSTARAFIQR